MQLVLKNLVILYKICVSDHIRNEIEPFLNVHHSRLW